jgi:hypothetical protein
MAGWLSRIKSRTRRRHSKQLPSSVPNMVLGQNLFQPLITGRGPWKFGVLVAAIIIGIFALFEMVPRLEKSLGRYASTEHGFGLAPPTSARAMGSQPATNPTTSIRPGVETLPSSAAGGKDESHPPLASSLVNQYRAWLEHLNSVLGLHSGTRIDAVNARASVWTVQSSGYYYCARDTHFGKLKPGAIMRQGNALQRGYRPRLGNYCP